MTEQGERQVVPIRLILRVHVRSVSPFDVAEMQELVREALSEWPDVEVETAMMPLMPQR